MFWYSSFTTLVIFFAVIVQISVVAYAKIHVAAIRATVRDLSFHWGNTVRYYFYFLAHSLIFLKYKYVVSHITHN